MQMKRARVYLGTNLSKPHDKVIIKVQPGKHGRREADVLRRVNATPATRSVKLLAHLELAGDDDALVLARAPHEFAARTVTGLKQFQDLCQVRRGSVPHDAGVCLDGDLLAGCLLAWWWSGCASVARSWCAALGHQAKQRRC